MALRRHRKDESTDATDERGSAPAEADEELDGPFDIDDFDDPSVAALARLDLGSVLIPMPEAGQVQVEVGENGVPTAVWVVTPNGRFTIAAYAAPKSAGLWREVASELADSLRKDVPTVSIVDGPWGREVIGAGGQGNVVVRFIGVDGYRWMIRCVVNGPQDRIDALVDQARNALADTVVRRGDTPMPVRTPLQVQLPEPMAAQLRAAAEQAAAQQAAARQQSGQQQPNPQQPNPQQTNPQQPDPQPGADPQQPQAQPAARRSTPGSAMQQLRTITGG
ncbi:DUF3710 domain-containing protein [uncultured Mycolicibacterium sp.]|uniref:DUF3710 domain-containing protein n=1 Tax=uncultured Mycolicibacterium sp. TaxID=2320817 RepID=UPI0032B1A414